MKNEYIDQYGIDSLIHLKLAKKSGADIFVTLNKELLKDRKELEQIFKIKIKSPEEITDES